MSGHIQCGIVYTTFQAPRYVGRYYIDGCVCFNSTKRPALLHRTMMRLLLGWEWKDNK